MIRAFSTHTENSASVVLTRSQPHDSVLISFIEFADSEGIKVKDRPYFRKLFKTLNHG